MRTLFCGFIPLGGVRICIFFDALEHHRGQVIGERFAMKRNLTELRKDISRMIGIQAHDAATEIHYTVISSAKENGYTRQLIEYDSYGVQVRAFLLLPETLNNNPACLINHQHNSQRHLGKSEVCGLAGDPLQAFGPKLARSGFVVLAPDSICFEDRRKNACGTSITSEYSDFLEHYKELCYRILKGECLLKKCCMTA
jgi:hypothetical protein